MGEWAMAGFLFLDEPLIDIALEDGSEFGRGFGG